MSRRLSRSRQLPGGEVSGRDGLTRSCNGAGEPSRDLRSSAGAIPCQYLIPLALRAVWNRTEASVKGKQRNESQTRPVTTLTAYFELGMRG